MQSSKIGSQLLTEAQYAEALFTNHACFLAEPGWQEVLAEPIFLPSGLPSPTWNIHGVLPHLCKVPELLADCRIIIFDQSEQTCARIQGLLRKTEQLRSLFVDLARTRQWDIADLSNVMSDNIEGKARRYFFSHEDLITENFCNHRQGMIVLNRIIYALDSSARLYEEETMAFAREVVKLHSAIEIHPERGPLHRILSVRVSHAALVSAEAWAGRGKPASRSAQMGVISRTAFGHFDDFLCGRKVGAPETLPDWQKYGTAFPDQDRILSIRGR